VKVLKFATNTIEKGKLFVTVRYGQDWSDLDVDQEVGLRENGSSTIVVAKVEFIAKARLKDIPQAILDLEHDPVCRTLEGLTTVLEEFYPRRVRMDQVFTIIGYKVD
jgi:hypothetical protein